ncbi:chemotaxis protein CheC [Desnuesiella massiliensis]|uniref:chemotaxis protein CheC n=1 Tax=Desnuesiella massiliensis TaxID=1650662 RepID=UPI0006E2EAA7|nr:chemotaxis protein CheC [Desnuesiella massiliensis]
MNNKLLRYDILKELFNISVGKAASMLSEIINKKILLDVPNIEIADSKEGDFKLDNYLPKVLDGALMVSSISFKENLTGEANLIFPAEKMRTFINLCSNQEGEDSYQDVNFTDIDFDIVKEIGNIILNSLIGEISNYLDINLDYSLPEVKVFDKIDFKNDVTNRDYLHILLLYITFNIDDTEIEGAIIISLTLTSLNELLKKIDKIEDGLYE